MNPVDRVLKIMRDTFGRSFAAYYDGDPDVIPRFNMPCVIVTQTKDDTTEGEMGEDDVADEIRIKLVLDKKDDYTGSIEVNESGFITNTTDKRLRTFVSRRNDKNEYETGTVKYALRTAMLDGVVAIAPTMNIQYGINERQTLGEPDKFVELTAEAWITFSIQSSVNTYR